MSDQQKRLVKKLLLRKTKKTSTLQTATIVKQCEHFLMLGMEKPTDIKKYAAEIQHEISSSF
jgi:hypothetical protein